LIDGCEYEQMDHINDVTCYSNFLIQVKNKPHGSIYHAQFSKYAKFRKNRTLQTHGNMGSQTCHFYKETIDDVKINCLITQLP